MKNVRCACLIAIVFLMAGCAGSNRSTRVIDEGEGYSVRLERVSPDPGYAHPVDLNAETIRTALGSLVVKRSVPLLKRILTQRSEVKEAAFSSEEAALLADRFKIAFARATPEERVAFFLTSGKGSMTTEVTSGVAFFKGRELHLVLANDHTAVSSEGRPWIPFEDPLRPYEVGDFEFAAQPPYQKRETSDAMKGRQEEVALDYEALASNPAPSEKKEAPSPSDDARIERPGAERLIEERLRLLKKFREESLITEEEYAEKKRELLKSLNPNP